MTTQNPIALAHHYADAAIDCLMRPGSGNRHSCPDLAEDSKIRRLSELYAAQVIGTVGFAAEQEMHTLEDQFRAEL